MTEKKFILICLSCLLITGCTARVKKDAQGIRITKKEPKKCKYMGEAVGSQGNSYTGKYTRIAAMEQGSMNRLKNKALKIGGDTVFILNRRETPAKTKKGKDYISNITFSGAVYKCN